MYDWLLTLPDEVRYMWSRSSPRRSILSAVSLLFAFNRYIVLLGWLPAVALALLEIYVPLQVSPDFLQLLFDLSLTTEELRIQKRERCLLGTR